MSVPVEAITKKRLDDWAKCLSDDHGTPLLLLGVGHDHNKGRLILCVVDEKEMVLPMLCLLVGAALEILENKLAEETMRG